MPYTVSKEFAFAAGHFIPGHPGKCRHMHGHNYRVRVFLRADTLDAIGMVYDFAHLKAMMNEVVGGFDHRVINDIPPFDTVSPTAENLAAYVFNEVHSRLSDDSSAGDSAASKRVSVVKVELWENTTSCAIYEP